LDVTKSSVVCISCVLYDQLEIAVNITVKVFNITGIFLKLKCFLNNKLYSCIVPPKTTCNQSCNMVAPHAL